MEAALTQDQRLVGRILGGVYLRGGLTQEVGLATNELPQLTGRMLAASYPSLGTLTAPGLVTNMPLTGRASAGTYTQAALIPTNAVSEFDDSGFTVFGLDSNSRVIYVSQSIGSDTNDGTQSNIGGAGVGPYATAATGLGDLRDGFADQCLFRRGDTWTTGAMYIPLVAGISTNLRILVGAYGPLSNARPRFAPSTASPAGQLYGVTRTNFAHNFLAIASLEFDGSSRFANNSNNAYGLLYHGTGSNVLIEDVWSHHWRNNCWINGGYTNALTVQDMVIRRCQFTDAFRSSGHAQGMFIAGTDNPGFARNNGTIIEECLYDHNGWHESSNSLNPESGSHNFYLTSGVDEGSTTFRNNISTRASYTGFQMRSGGDCVNNVFSHNAAHLTWGIVTGGSDPVVGGVTGSVCGNVFLDLTDILTQPTPNAEGGVVDIGNVLACTFTNNIATRCTSVSATPSGYHLIGDIGGEVDIGINNLIFRRNYCYNLMMTNASPQGEGGGGRAIFFEDGTNVVSNSILQSNNFQYSESYRDYNSGWLTNDRVVFNNGAGGGLAYSMSNNTYYTPNVSNEWCITPSTNSTTLTAWASEANETNYHQLSNVTAFSAPDRRLSDYYDLVEGTTNGTLTNYIDRCREQRKGNWRPAYEALPAINFIRQGFDLDDVS